MKISGLDTKQYIPGVDPTGETSYLIINCLAEVYNEETAITETKPLTYKVSLDELGKMLITSKQLVTYNNLDGESNPVKQLKTIGTENSAYSVQDVGQYIDADDRTTLNNVQTDYTDTNYPDPETVNWNKYYVKAVTNTNGTIATEHAQFAPSITWTDAVAGTNDAKPTIGISVGGNESGTVTPNVATTSVYGITKLYDGTDSTSTALAATANSVKSALDAASTDAGNQIAALDVTNNTEDTHYITGFSAAKTLSTLTQTDGLISASFQDIAIPESAVTNLVADLAEKAPLSSPKFSGAIRLGNTSPTLGTYTILAGFNGSANVQSSLLCGDYLSAGGSWSSILGYRLSSQGTCTHVVGKYNGSDIMDTWHSSEHYYVGDMVQTLQHHVTGESGNILYFKCIEENTDVSFIDSKWERLDHITGKFVEMVGNGTNGANSSNARALDWNGNEYLNGDLYVTCDASSKNGKKVATEEYVDAKVPTPPTTNGTYNLQVVINGDTATYSWVSTT